MPYFIFAKNQENVIGSIYRICKNPNDLNNFNINLNDYKIIEDTQENFDSVNIGIKFPSQYDFNNVITYTTQKNLFKNKEDLQKYLDQSKVMIKQFLDNNPNSIFFNTWNSYYNQLNNLNLNSIAYPLNKSLEEYLKDLNQPYFNILQLP